MPLHLFIYIYDIHFRQSKKEMRAFSSLFSNLEHLFAIWVKLGTSYWNQEKLCESELKIVVNEAITLFAWMFLANWEKAVGHLAFISEPWGWVLWTARGLCRLLLNSSVWSTYASWYMSLLIHHFFFIYSAYLSLHKIAFICSSSFGRLWAYPNNSSANINWHFLFWKAVSLWHKLWMSN